MPCSPQPSTIVKEENCLCAFPPKTDAANLALNADRGRLEISLFNRFQKLTIYFSCKRLHFIGFREQQQNKQTVHWRPIIPVSEVDVLISQLSGSNASLLSIPAQALLTTCHFFVQLFMGVTLEIMRNQITRQ